MFENVQIGNAFEMAMYFLDRLLGFSIELNSGHHQTLYFFYIIFNIT